MTTKSKTRQIPRHRRSPPFLEPVFLATGALNSGTGLGVPQSLSTTDRSLSVGFVLTYDFAVPC